MESKVYIIIYVIPNNSLLQNIVEKNQKKFMIRINLISREIDKFDNSIDLSSLLTSLNHVLYYLNKYLNNKHNMLKIKH